MAQQHQLPLENLIAPDALRRLLWAPDGLSAPDLDTQLSGYGVRPWQRELVVPVIADILARLST